MKKIIYVFLMLLTLASCSNTYDIKGYTDVSNLDGRMLYLKVLKNNDFKTLDSCDVVHGEFHFSGVYDSICIANIMLNDGSVLPLVLESGEITVKIENTQHTVSGTPMNEELSDFLVRYSQIASQKAELQHTHDQAIMNGEDMLKVTEDINKQFLVLTDQEDSLVTNFISDNFDNVLGPGVFLMLTVGNRYPELTPWVEYIMSKATDKFKSDPYVKDYYEKAQENQAILNGLKDLPPALPVQPVPPSATPNDLAKPAPNQ